MNGRVICQDTHFNSIKVQLEPDNPAVGDTIVLNFNSIKVQLERRCRFSKLSLGHHFNSIKVQLERNAISSRTIPALFQFHKGTIRTP